jgi:nitroimidazol reductase NimA-like FMN-containing flavoprotein (pyridoxamine 5'-phosphate oxidase superfamily)
MQTRQTVEPDIRKLLQNEQLAVLSTEQHGQPYASLVAFAVTAGLETLLFCTPKTTRKFDNLVHNPQVAMLINNGRNQASDIDNAISVTAVGKASEVVDSAGKDLSALFVQKHPHLKAFLQAEDTALVRIRVERYIMVCKFQEVFLYEVNSSND